MKFLLCGALQRTIWDEYIIDVLEKSENLQYGQPIFLLMASAKIKIRLANAGAIVHQGLVEQTTDGYPVLKLNAFSWEVMRQRSVSIVATNSAKQTLRDEGY